MIGHKQTLFGLIAALTIVPAQSQDKTFYEQNGLVVVECESVPPGDDWVLRSGSYTLDGSHTVEGYTGNGCYHFTGNRETSGNASGFMAYGIHITNPGSYRLSMRGMEAPIETGEGDKANDCYIKMDGQSGCEGKFTKYVRLGGSFNWTFGIRLECSHHSFSDAVYDLSAGTHTFWIAGRSKNFLVDRFVLFNSDLSNVDPEDLNLPESSTDDSSLPPVPEQVAINATDFSSRGDFYIDGKYLAIDPLNDSDQKATATENFPGTDGEYDITFYGVGEEDGESVYKLWINGDLIGEYQVDTTSESFAEGERFNRTWTGVTVNADDEIKVEAEARSNGTIEENGAPGGYAWSRGRWYKIDFVPAGGSSGGGEPAVIESPAAGSVLVMGSTITLKGAGTNLSWSYDANSDKKGQLAIGEGEQVSFTVPTDVVSPLQITIILNGSGGKTEKTYDLAEGGSTVVMPRRSSTCAERSERVVLYSINGKKIRISNNASRRPVGIVITQSDNAAQPRVLLK